MTSRDFAYWLQGMFELADPKALDERATALIKAHLAMVFIHEIDPSMPSAKLDAAHQIVPPNVPTAAATPIVGNAHVGTMHEPFGGQALDGTLYRC